MDGHVKQFSSVFIVWQVLQYLNSETVHLELFV